MKKLTIIALVAAFGFVSCKDTDKETNTTDTSAETTAPANEATPVNSHDGHDHSHDGHDHSHDGHSHSNETAQGMNPPHGEPGHRCDIPVGAPLNSAPAQPTASTPANSGGQGFLGSGEAQAPAQQATPQQQFKTEPGMQGKPNPAHGQPGHRCDIQVGEPLP